MTIRHFSEQGDPLMPMLFSLGQHMALVVVQSKLLEDEKLLAFLDDVHVCRPSRVHEVFCGMPVAWSPR